MGSVQEQNHREAAPRRTRRNESISVESLEGRALLSGFHALAANHVHGPLPVAALVVHHDQVQHQVTNSVVELARKPTGVVTKRPHFYEFYTGEKAKSVNATGASVILSTRRNTFTFTGTVQGRINDSGDIYVWGIDRNGQLGPGPFQGRPNIKFDAVVVVTLDASLRPTAQVIDLKSGTMTTLSAGSASIRGRMVNVVVPASLLPSTGLAPSQYRFNMWPDYDTLASVASFVPEFTDAQVGVRR
jgi:hypothetical protein